MTSRSPTFENLRLSTNAARQETDENSNSSLPFRVDGSASRRAMFRLAEAGHMAKVVTNMSWSKSLESGEKKPILELLGRLAEALPIAPDSAAGPKVEEKQNLLATIHDQIIPRLVLAHRTEQAAPAEEACPDSRLPPTTEEVSAFALIAISQDLPRALAFVENLASEGLSLEIILLHLIAPTARLLGDEWLDDMTTFTDVTIGLSTLQQVVHVLGPSFAPGALNRGFVVLVSPQAEQHTLGIYLLGEFLRRAGWGVQVAPSMSEMDLVSLVQSEHVEMVGISVSNTHLLAPVTRLVAAVKKASQNKNLCLMLGGSPDVAKYAVEIGALFSSDPRDVVRLLENHVKNGDDTPAS